jgi:hypothetical protein
MATKSAVNVPGSIRVLAILVMAAGAIMVAAGVGTWFMVQSQLSDERITVSDDAAHFAGDAVDGPLTAYSQAQTIEKHAIKASGGKTYAELPQDDPTRNTVMTASFLRASLFTSVVSFGVAAMAGGLGIVLLLIGWALLSLTSALRSVAAETSPP